MSERKASPKYGPILQFCRNLEIEAYWKENVAAVAIGMNAPVVVEELMKRQGIYWQRILAAGSILRRTRKPTRKVPTTNLKLE